MMSLEQLSRSPPDAKERRPAESVRPLPSSADGALNEVLAAAYDITSWTALANREIRGRYRRTVLGPIWIVILVMVSAAAISLVYGALLGRPFATYFVFVVVSLVSWTLIANVISEAASLLWLSGTLMKTFQVSAVTLVLANLLKNLIVWAHAILPALICAAIVMPGDVRAMMMLPAGLFLVLLNLGWIAFEIALLGTRFRDVYDLVIMLMTLAFLVTPVIWDSSMLGELSYLAELNPLTHLLDLIRRPVLGQWPALTSVVVGGFGAVLGWPLVTLLFAASRQRLAFWV
jgi:ABC-type polysaccharide/polyol phosphate export permease